MLSVSGISFNSKANQVNVSNQQQNQVAKLYSQPIMDTISFGSRYQKLFTDANAEKLQALAKHMLEDHPLLEIAGHGGDGYMLRGNNIQFLFKDPAYVTSKLTLDLITKKGKVTGFEVLYGEAPAGSDGIQQFEGRITANSGFKGIYKAFKNKGFNLETLNEILDRTPKKELYSQG